MDKDNMDLIGTVNRMNPEAAAKLQGFSRAGIKKEDKEKAMEEVNKQIEQVVAKLDNQDVTMGDLQKKMEEFDKERNDHQTIEEAVKEAAEINEQDELDDVLDRIDETNFVDAQYIDYFSLLPFKRRLELLEVSEEEAASLCDSLITKGYITRSFKIRKLSVELISREVDIYLKTVDRLDTSRRSSQLKAMEIMSLYNTAGSLLRFGDTKFTVYKDVKEEDREQYLEDKIKFVVNLPSSVYAIVARETSKLDLLTGLITSEEGIRNLPEGPGEQED